MGRQGSPEQGSVSQDVVLQHVASPVLTQLHDATHISSGGQHCGPHCGLADCRNLPVDGELGPVPTPAATSELIGLT